MGRPHSAPDLAQQIVRMQEEIRQLRLRDTGSFPPGPWQLLYPFLHPAWATTFASHDPSDSTNQLRPRYRIDRGTVFLDGIVKFDAAALTGAEYIIADGTIGTEYIADGQQSDYTLTENMDFTDNSPVNPMSVPGWQRTGQIVGGAAGFFSLLIVVGTTDPIPDGLAISLNGISWRVGV